MKTSELTEYLVKVAVNKISKDIKSGFGAFGGLNKNTYATTIKSTGTSLTLKDLENAFKAVKKVEEKREKIANMVAKNRKWRKLNNGLLKVLSWLMNQGRTFDYFSVYSCWLSIQPHNLYPVSPRCKNNCLKIIREYETYLINN